MKKLVSNVLVIVPILLLTIILSSCSDNIVNDLISNKITAKDRIDSAYAQARRTYSPSVKLVMVFGKNVLIDGTDAGRTDITLTSGITDPNNIGAWLYIFKKPGSNDLAVYTPNPTPGARDCIELTSVFNFNTVLSLIADTSAKNIVSGCLNLITNSNFQISTGMDSLVNSDVAYGYAYNYSPVIKFNSSFTPSSSNVNGSTLFSQTGTNKTANMFLLPALGTMRLDLPQYISNLVGLPQDLWIVNYKMDVNGSTQNYIFGTVVRSDQNMGISALGLISKAINISKF